MEEEKEKKEFDLGKIEIILDPPYVEYEYDDKLTYAKEFMSACADCLNFDDNIVMDTQKLLLRFEEVFLASLKLIEEFNPSLAIRVKEIDSQLQLSHNAVKLSMLSEKYRKPNALEVLLRTLFKITFEIKGISIDLPDKGRVKLSEDILVEIRAALYRLSGLMSSAAGDAKKWYRENEDVLVVDGFYDPRRIPKKYLLLLLQRAKSSVEKENKIPPSMKEAILTEITDIEEQLKKNKTSWNKVCSKITQVVMLLSALITIGANIDEAYLNVEKAYNYTKSAMSYIAENALSLPKFHELTNGEKKDTLQINDNIESMDDDKDIFADKN
jgi:hypothetical protein